jgi:hypothetical protein
MRGTLAEQIGPRAPQEPEAERAVALPVECHRGRRPPIVSLADPRDLPHPQRVRDGPAHLVGIHLRVLPHRWSPVCSYHAHSFEAFL